MFIVGENYEEINEGEGVWEAVQEGKTLSQRLLGPAVKNKCVHSHNNKNMEYKFNQYFKIHLLVKWQEKTGN